MKITVTLFLPDGSLEVREVNRWRYEANHRLLEMWSEQGHAMTNLPFQILEEEENASPAPRIITN